MRDVLTRVMSTRGESTESMILYSAIVMIVASGLLSGGSADLSAVDGVQVALLATSGLVYLAALYCIAESLKRAKASSVAPFRYTTIGWASALDFLIWHNPPAPNVIGGTLIVFAAMYALLRLEARELAR
jgi:drug/metabolite transporter (DMT)-like permease